MSSKHCTYILIAFLGLLLIFGASRALTGMYENLLGFASPSIVVSETNNERSQSGKTALKRSEILDRAATLKARDMLENQYFSHKSPTGVTPWYWFDRVGYRYIKAGENLAIHFEDSKELVQAWMNSTSHRANILSNNYTETGIGTATGIFEGATTTFTVQMFGTPRSEKRFHITFNLLSTAIGGVDADYVTKSDNTNVPINTLATIVLVENRDDTATDIEILVVLSVLFSIFVLCSAKKILTPNTTRTRLITLIVLFVMTLIFFVFVL